MRISRGQLFVLFVAGVLVGGVVAYPPKLVQRTYVVQEGTPTGDGGRANAY